MSLFGNTFTFMSSIFFVDIVRSCSHIMTLFPRLIIYFALTLIIFYLFICFSFLLLWYYIYISIFILEQRIYFFLSFFLTGSFLLFSAFPFVYPVFYFTPWTLCDYQPTLVQIETSSQTDDFVQWIARSTWSESSISRISLFLSLYFSSFLLQPP